MYSPKYHSRTIECLQKKIRGAIYVVVLWFNIQRYYQNLSLRPIYKFAMKYHVFTISICSTMAVYSKPHGYIVVLHNTLLRLLLLGISHFWPPNRVVGKVPLQQPDFWLDWRRLSTVATTRDLIEAGKSHSISMLMMSPFAITHMSNNLVMSCLP